MAIANCPNVGWAEVRLSPVPLPLVHQLSASFPQLIEATYTTQAQLGRDINPKAMTTDEWTDKQAKGNPFAHELLAKPHILLIGELHA